MGKPAWSRRMVDQGGTIIVGPSRDPIWIVIGRSIFAPWGIRHATIICREFMQAKPTAFSMGFAAAKALFPTIRLINKAVSRQPIFLRIHIKLLSTKQYHYNAVVPLCQRQKFPHIDYIAKEVMLTDNSCKCCLCMFYTQFAQLTVLPQIRSDQKMQKLDIGQQL